MSKVADEQLFYLMSRGLSEEQAMAMVVNGFIEPVTRTLPMEYAVEWSRLIELSRWRGRLSLHLAGAAAAPRPAGAHHPPAGSAPGFFPLAFLLHFFPPKVDRRQPAVDLRWGDNPLPGVPPDARAGWRSGTCSSASAGWPTG